jgi:hypothetical protein
LLADIVAVQKSVETAGRARRAEWRRLRGVVLVLNLTDQFLDHVLQGHDAVGAAGLSALSPHDRVTNIHS